MKKYLWIVSILLCLFPEPTVSECSKTYFKNESTDSGNFECVNGGCWIQIDPSPTKGIYLNLQGKGNKLFMYMTTSGKQKQEFLQKESERTDERYYLADVGQGFLIKWNKSCYSNTDAPHYIFNREILDPYYCGPHLRYIGNEVVTVQKENRAKSQFSCRYHMVPFDSNRSSETIYVISGTSNTFDVFDGNNERYKITGQIVSRDYWKYVDFEKQYSGTRWQGADLEYIYAITTKRSCVCQDEPVEVSNGQVIHIQSPGFPDFMCPSSKCEKRVTFSKYNGSDEYIQRALVTLEARAKTGTNFSLVSTIFDVRFDNDIYSTVFTNFLLEPVDMKVEHSTQLNLYHGPEGHFNMTIRSIQIRKDCACSLFKQKKYDKQEHKIKIKIPAHCELIFCDWTIASGGKKEMTVKIDNGKENDEVHIWNQNSMEKYNSTQLKQPRKLYLTTSSDTHVSFRRNTSGVLQQNFPSLVTVSWITASDTMCYKQSNVSLTTTPQAFISSNYPLPYNFFGTCQTLLVAPDNHYIKLNVSDIDVENIHDHVSFYDGNNTSSEFLLEQLTGTHQALTLSSNDNMMTINFYSDSSHGRRGYHFVAFAVAKPTPKSTEVAMPTMEETSSDKLGKPTQIIDHLQSNDSFVDPFWLIESKNATTSGTDNLQSSGSKHGFFFYLFYTFCVVFITIGTLFGGFALYKNLYPKKPETSFANEMVRFRNDDTGSVVTIENRC
ncbi:hypothetical protein L5515_016953 [Caenorhabditis briggsae]|uniref:CUB domain-containing protein n=1 Tax=Caenorhabditis briggsae TaxID=6238 RepID=A0AAE9F864_CAEBR|nr:hypothetical protein L5515_016953 [Caenorhabditis briggsae]